MNPVDPSPPRRKPPSLGAPSAPGDSGDRKSALDRLLAYRVLLTLTLVILALDQLTKAWIAARLPFPTYGDPGGAIPIVKGFFYLVHVGNTGAAWSMFSGQSVMLAVLAAATLVAIWFWRSALHLRERLPQIAFGLLCGGIVGNLLDRLRHGHVVDFVDLHFGTYIYPTFNVADSGICVGVFLYLWQSLREH